MILFPAIDLSHGRCVRLVQGDMTRATVFNEDPAAQAAAFERQGFRWLHVVDLDGAFAGKPMNVGAIELILAATRNPIQLGGGVRDIATVEGWLSRGVRRVIIGTAAVKNPALVREAARRFPGSIAVGVDARRGRVAIEGWSDDASMGAEELALRFEDAGVAAIVFTDIERDGMLGGANWEATAALARAVATPVIASGGVASLDDIRTLASPQFAALEGAIVGRALYDGRLDAAAALEIVAAARDAARC